jgi:hypothetical protein
MWRLALILVAGCGRHLNPEWCTQSGHSDPACPQGTPDAPDMTLGACAADDACPGTICLPTGACLDPAAALYATPNGKGTACTSDAKCSLPAAIIAATSTRYIIVLDPMTYLGPVRIDHPVQIIGPNATLQMTASGDTVTVTNNVTAELYGVSIIGAIGASGISCLSGTLGAHAIKLNNNQLGITSTCALTLERSIVNTNTEGALQITAGTIDIHENFIVNNGKALKGTANVSIASGVKGSFSFNTVAYNDAKPNADPGVDCNSIDVIGAGNLVTDNTHNRMFDGSPQVLPETGACDFTSSYTLPGAGGNDLQWRNVMTSDFHLTVDSTAVLDSATLDCAGRTDIDGEPRPSGDGCDYGADELTR